MINDKERSPKQKYGRDIILEDLNNKSSKLFQIVDGSVANLMKILDYRKQDFYTNSTKNPFNDEIEKKLYKKLETINPPSNNFSNKKRASISKSNNKNSKSRLLESDDFGYTDDEEEAKNKKKVNEIFTYTDINVRGPQNFEVKVGNHININESNVKAETRSSNTYNKLKNKIRVRTLSRQANERSNNNEHLGKSGYHTHSQENNYSTQNNYTPENNYSTQNNYGKDSFSDNQKLNFAGSSEINTTISLTTQIKTNYRMRGNTLQNKPGKNPINTTKPDNLVILRKQTINSSNIMMNNWDSDEESNNNLSIYNAKTVAVSPAKKYQNAAKKKFEKFKTSKYINSESEFVDTERTIENIKSNRKNSVDKSWGSIVNEDNASPKDGVNYEAKFTTLKLYNEDDNEISFGNFMRAAKSSVVIPESKLLSNYEFNKLKS